MIQKKEQLKKLTGTYDEDSNSTFKCYSLSKTNVILFTQEVWVLKFNNKEQIDNTFIQSNTIAQSLLEMHSVCASMAVHVGSLYTV